MSAEDNELRREIAVIAGHMIHCLTLRLTVVLFIFIEDDHWPAPNVIGTESLFAQAVGFPPQGLAIFHV